MYTPLAIPRRYIWVAAGAAAAGAVMYLRNRFGNDEREEFYESKKREEPKRPAPKKDDDGAAKKDDAGAASNDDENKASKPAAGGADGAKKDDDAKGGARELAEFLSGDSWYDESGWRAIWEREGVEDAAAWLRSEGAAVLKKERNVLSDHPALLAGCRRRWIVVCRYAGIDVSDAAALWNETDV